MAFLVTTYGIRVFKGYEFSGNVKRNNMDYRFGQMEKNSKIITLSTLVLSGMIGCSWACVLDISKYPIQQVFRAVDETKKDDAPAVSRQHSVLGPHPKKRHKTNSKGFAIGVESSIQISLCKLAYKMRLFRISQLNERWLSIQRISAENSLPMDGSSSNGEVTIR